MKNNLPIARPVTDSLVTFDDCITWTQSNFAIGNMGVVKAPEWVLGRLL